MEDNMIKNCRIIFLISILFSSVALGQLDGFKFYELPKDSLLHIAKEIIETDIATTIRGACSIVVHPDDRTIVRRS